MATNHMTPMIRQKLRELGKPYVEGYEVSNHRVNIDDVTFIGDLSIEEQMGDTFALYDLTFDQVMRILEVL